MKLTLCSAIGIPLLFASCTSLDPEYADYKKQKEAEAAAGAPYGGNADPYGVPGGASGSETGSYVPYQPLPGVNPPAPSADPLGSVGAPDPAFPPIPSTPGASNVPSAPPSLGTATPHVVVVGDSLWGLSKRYNTSVDAIRAANGIPAGSTTIQTGRTLQIPQP